MVPAKGGTPVTEQQLPTIPWEPQATDDELADALRRRGWVCYRKRPYMRGGKVRLRDGTVLVQTTVEEVTADEG